MKNIFKFLLGFIIVVYVLIAIFTTAFLLNRNDYSVTEFGKYSLLIANDDELKPYYSNGTLLVISKTDDINVGDEIFYYDTYSNELVVKYNIVTKKEKITDDEITYTTKDNAVLSSEYVIGSSKTTTQYSGIGAILNVLQSKWGFLFIIVFPLFLAFIYELYAVIRELKKS